MGRGSPPECAPETTTEPTVQGMRAIAHSRRELGRDRQARRLAADPFDYPDGLTAREGEVLRHIAAGETNAKIAEALVISPATVTRHVTNILTKTDLSNRTELARYATEQGLTG